MEALDKTLAEIEREAIEQRLADKDWNITHAAQSLDISERTVQRKMSAWAAADNLARRAVADRV